MVESIIESGVLALDEAPIALPSFKFLQLLTKARNSSRGKMNFYVADICCLLYCRIVVLQRISIVNISGRK